MENKKEPLMSAKEWYYDQLLKQSGKILSNFEIGQQYANYVTQWHLNNAKEFVADGIKYNHTCNDGKGCGIHYCDSLCGNIDKQSIHTAIDNYIEINNLNKEL